MGSHKNYGATAREVSGANVAGNGDNIQVVGSTNTIASTGSAAGSSVFGLGNTVNATNAVVMGNSNTVTGANGIAIGNGAPATRANQQVFGTASNTYTMSGVTSAASRSAQSGPTQIVTSD